MDLLALPTYYRRSRRYWVHGPRHLLMYILGRFGPVRSCMVWRYSLRTTVPAVASTSSIVTTADLNDVVQKIRKDGYCTGLNLRPEVIEQLLTFSSMATCYGEGNEEFPFHYRDRHEAQRRAGRRFRLGRYNHALTASHALGALANDEQLLAIARKYFRTEPVLVGARMWWSLAGPANSDALGRLGITAGVITASAKKGSTSSTTGTSFGTNLSKSSSSNTSSTAKPVIGLGLNTQIDLLSSGDANVAKVSLQNVMTAITNAYQTLNTPASSTSSSPSAPASKQTPPPTILAQQQAGYSLALATLASMNSLSSTSSTTNSIGISSSALLTALTA